MQLGVLGLNELFGLSSHFVNYLDPREGN